MTSDFANGRKPDNWCRTKRAGQAIEQQFRLLETAPDIGRPFPEMPELRELVIAFGDSGYVALYRHEATDDAVYVLAFRHQREAGYY
ncbi:MAG: type II toxin-antitoxin system RelE/ParE family toxin [Candidatus Accumulibacter sp.]|nr:type II toxin-antitoxin system RelE/ParE family toxin [Accumulibacter sp.]